MPGLPLHVDVATATGPTKTAGRVRDRGARTHPGPAGPAKRGNVGRRPERRRPARAAGGRPSASRRASRTHHALNTGREFPRRELRAGHVTLAPTARTRTARAGLFVRARY